METVTLKNGAEEVKSAVGLLLVVLRDLLKENPMAFYDVVMVARDPAYIDRVFPIHKMTLTGLNLLEASGNMHDTIRNIILSAVEGDGPEMTLTNPIA